MSTGKTNCLTLLYTFFFTLYIGFLKIIANLTVESLMNVINNLYDLTANGLSGKTLNFGTHNLKKLTDEQIAIAIAKGWTLI